MENIENMTQSKRRDLSHTVDVFIELSFMLLLFKNVLMKD